MGLSATLIPLLTVQHGWPSPLATIIAILASGAVGLINGALVVGIGVDAIVATLGMGTFVLGMTLWSSNLNAVQGLSASYSEISLKDIFGLPIGFYYGVAACLVLAYVLNLTPLGRRMAFVGSSREVARLAGINVNRVRFGSYVAAGLICGLAGMLVSSSLGGYDPSTSGQYLLPAFASVFLGTAVIQPGKFNPIGALVAVYFLQTGIVGLELKGLTGWVGSFFYGGALVVAITATTLIRRRAAT
jgi:ribose transport system permease protein